MMRRVTPIALVALAVAALAGCGPVSPNATRKDFEARHLKWPLTVDAGTLGCEGKAVWFEADGKRYAVNGAAASRFAAIDPIWAYDEKMATDLRGAGAPDIAPVRISIGDLIDEGLKRC